MGIIGSIASWAGRAFGGATSAGAAPLMPIPQSQNQWNGVLTGLFGPPGSSDPTVDRAVSDVYNGPYRGPGDLDRDGCETAEQRRQYRYWYNTSPVLYAAQSGKADDLAALEVTVLASDKDDREANLAAEFVNWTVSMAPGGWPGLIRNTYLPGSIDGFSVLEKRLKQQFWKGRSLWGLAHCRSLDTCHVRLQLDVYRNVIGVVNLVRGLEYYNPDGYLLYTHNGLFSNPFGRADGRAAMSAAADISDVYKLWYIALKVYGLPYMLGKTKDTQRRMMEDALQALRGGGWAVVTDKDATIDVVNLATGAALNGFESYVHTKREDIFFATRGVAQPFMEGDGGADAHTDTTVQQGSSNAGEKRIANNLADVYNRQLIPWLVGPNFNLDESRMPRAKFGGTDWKQVQTVISVVRDAQEVGVQVSAEWVHEATSMPAPRDENDRLVSAQEKQQQQQVQAQQQQAVQQLGAADPNAPPAAPTQPASPDTASLFTTEAVTAKWLPTARLVSDPDRFQFRDDYDAGDGTVRELPEEAFDADLCPPLSVWADPEDGEVYVVDGHHRLAWAERDGVKRLKVRFLPAETAEEAKAMGEALNRGRVAPKTFSDGDGRRKVAAEEVSAEQVARVVEQLLKEMQA